MEFVKDKECWVGILWYSIRSESYSTMVNDKDYWLMQGKMINQNVTVQHPFFPEKSVTIDNIEIEFKRKDGLAFSQWCRPSWCHETKEDAINGIIEQTEEQKVIVDTWAGLKKAKLQEIIDSVTRE